MKTHAEMTRWTSQDWVRWALWSLCAVVVLAASAIGWWWQADMVNLSEAPSAQAFGAQVHRLAGLTWPSDALAPDILAGLARSASDLRLVLVLESLLLVPASVGMAVLAIFVLDDASGPRQTWLPHLVCVAPVAAGLFNLAENAMLGRAMRDYLGATLANETVLDVVSAHQWKGHLLAVALVSLAWLSVEVARARRHHAGEVPVHVSAALCLVLAAVALYAPNAWLRLGMPAWALLALACQVSWLHTRMRAAPEVADVSLGVPGV
jgi:hypothetical protein